MAQGAFCAMEDRVLKASKMMRRRGFFISGL